MKYLLKNSLMKYRIFKLKKLVRFLKIDFII